MNLADAIRQARRPEQPFTDDASLRPALDVISVETAVPAEAQPVLREESVRAAQPKPEAARLELIPNEVEPEAGTPVPSLAIGGVVRLEMSLSPEQLTNFFRTVLGTQHSVMTAREAASLLRVTPSALEKMAEDRIIPALQIDGKWRFPRTGLEEWLSVQAATSSQEAGK